MKDVGGYYYYHMEAREEEVFLYSLFFSYTTLRVHTTMAPLSTNNKLFFSMAFIPLFLPSFEEGTVHTQLLPPFHVELYYF